MPSLLYVTLGTSLGLYLAVRSHWLAPEIVPLVRGPEHRRDLFRRRVYAQIPTAIASRALPAAGLASGRLGMLLIRTAPAGWSHAARFATRSSVYVSRLPTSPLASAAISSLVSKSRWFRRPVNSLRYRGRCWSETLWYVR